MDLYQSSLPAVFAAILVLYTIAECPLEILLKTLLKSLLKSLPMFLSGQAGLSGGFQMRAGPGLAAFRQAWRLFLAAWRLFLGGREAFLGGLSLNRIFCLLRKSPKYET